MQADVIPVVGQAAAASPVALAQLSERLANAKLEPVAASVNAGDPAQQVPGQEHLFLLPHNWPHNSELDVAFESGGMLNSADLCFRSHSQNIQSFSQSGPHSVFSQPPSGEHAFGGPAYSGFSGPGHLSSSSNAQGSVHEGSSAEMTGWFSSSSTPSHQHPPAPAVHLQQTGQRRNQGYRKLFQQVWLCTCC